MKPSSRSRSTPAKNKSRGPVKQVRNMFDFEGMSDDQIGQESSQEEVIRDLKP